MEKLKRPRSIQISNQKKLSNIKLSNNNTFIKNKLNINPFSQTIRNSSLNLFSTKNNQNCISSLNVTDKKLKKKIIFLKNQIDIS